MTHYSPKGYIFIHFLYILIMNCLGLLLTYTLFTSCLSPDNHQPIWVSWVQPSTPNPCEDRPAFKRDNKMELKSAEYTNSGYDRGHLCPNEDFGCPTFVMSNVVPMTPNFNRGSWKQSESYLRKTYPGSTIYKGCNYGAYKGVLQIPTSCWYKVFNAKGKLLEEKTIIQSSLKRDNLKNDTQTLWCESESCVVALGIAVVISPIVSLLLFISTISICCLRRNRNTEYIAV
jgi:DNA/RNA endonuclease G (NUC1)